MTFDEYLAELQDEIRQFDVWWKAMAVLNPEHFPKEMPAGEWDEQFRMWQASANKDVYKIEE